MTLIKLNRHFLWDQVHLTGLFTLISNRHHPVIIVITIIIIISIIVIFIGIIIIILVITTSIINVICIVIFVIIVIILSSSSFASLSLSSPSSLGTLNNDNDGGSENVAKKTNLRSIKLNRVYLDPLNM